MLGQHFSVEASQFRFVGAYIMLSTWPASVPECYRLQGLRGQPLEHPLQRRVQRVVFIAEGLAAALQQSLMVAGFTQHLLIPLAVHQELQDVGDCQLQVEGMLGGAESWRARR